MIIVGRLEKVWCRTAESQRCFGGAGVSETPSVWYGGSTSQYDDQSCWPCIKHKPTEEWTFTGLKLFSSIILVCPWQPFSSVPHWAHSYTTIPTSWLVGTSNLSLLENFCQYHLICSTSTWNLTICQWRHWPRSGAPLIKVALYKCLITITIMSSHLVTCVFLTLRLAFLAMLELRVPLSSLVKEML